MATASSISRKLAQEFDRQTYYASGQIKGCGTLTSGFSVKTEDKKIVVRCLGYGRNNNLANSKVDEIAAYLEKQGVAFTLDNDWRGNKIVIAD